jgi:A/G-specific adenine glycosylase
MLGLPTTDWRGAPWSTAEALAGAPLAGRWSEIDAVAHVFTHFSLTLKVYEARGVSDDPNLIWTSLQHARSKVPSVFRKALR